jgi:hypothetical protein
MARSWPPPNGRSCADKRGPLPYHPARMRLHALVGDRRIEVSALDSADGPVDVTVTEIPATAQTDIHTCPV